MKKKLIITTGFKGGAGRSFIARKIIPILYYKTNNNTKFNIVEISDLFEKDETISDFISIERFSSREMDYQKALHTAEYGVLDKNTDTNSIYILDISVSGNKKVEEILNYMSLLKLQNDLDLEFYIPVQKDSQNFLLTASILELINNFFGIKSTIIYNRVHKDYKKEYINFFGIKNNRDNISHLIKNEMVIYEDLEDVFNIISGAKKIEPLDYYINFLNTDKDSLPEIKKLKEDRESFDKYMRDRLLGCDLKGFIDKIEFIS